MKRLIIFFSLTFFFVLVQACRKSAVPSYLFIPGFDFEVLSNQGTDSHNFTEVWLYKDEQPLGVFAPPAMVPVIHDGSASIKVFAGIKNNGISDTRIRYPFITAFDTMLNFAPGHTDTIIPHFKYEELCTIEQQGFESGNFLVELSGNAGVFSAVTDDNLVFEGNRSGLGLLNSGAGKIYFKDDTNREFIGGQMYFLEMNYSCNNKMSVGLLVMEASGITKELALIVNPTQSADGTPVWKKIYVDFGAIPQKHPQALFYEWYIESIPDVPNKAIEVYLDNLKWVKWQ
jgi:hypothetical protein